MKTDEGKLVNTTTTTTTKKRRTVTSIGRSESEETPIGKKKREFFTTG